ncbi:MAG: cytochrome P450 [Actinomycetota bacterium]
MTVDDYSPIRPDVFDDPFPALAELRDQCPVHRTEALGRPMYTVARATDVHDILLDHRTWSNARGPGVADSTNGTGDLQHDDQPVHTRRRKLIRDWFNPAAVATLEPGLRATTVEAIDAFRVDGGVGRADLYGDLALPLPVASFCELMGVELTDRDQFLHWADELVTAMAYPERGADARRAMTAFTEAEIAERRRLAAAGEELPAGLLSFVATEPYADDGEPMPLREAVNMSNQLLIAGHETSASLITNAMWRLLEDRPNRWEVILDDESLIPAAIEESLRFDPPVLGICRTNNDPTTIADVDIPAESKVQVNYASANRDPERFERPDEFRLDRDPVAAAKHYAFSWGIHHCLGAHLARLTGRVVLEELRARVPTVRLAGDPTRVPSPFLWGRKTLPVEFDA